MGTEVEGLTETGVTSGRRVVWILMLVIGFSGMAGCSSPAPTSRQASGAAVDPSDLKTHLPVNLSLGGTILIPIVASEATVIEGNWVYEGVNPKGFGITYFAWNEAAPAQVVHQAWSGGPRYSSIKRMNEQASTYEEHCLDGRVRGGPSDQPCPMQILNHSRLGPYPFNRKPQIGPGHGYLIVSWWRSNLSLEFNFTRPVLVGEFIQASQTTRVFATENFDGAKYMEIEVCHQGFRFCGVVLDARLPLVVEPGRAMYVKAIASATTDSYLQFCQRLNNESTRTCAPRSQGVFSFGAIFEELLPSTTKAVQFEMDAATPRAVLPNNVPSMWVFGQYSSIDIPRVFPLPT